MSIGGQALPRPEWLRLTSQAALEPDRPICDPHHHLWDRPDDPYFVEDFAADLQSGHNIVSAVFIECGSRYLADGPEGMRPVGETAFAVQEAERAAGSPGIATEVAAGIVSFADLRLGAEVHRVLAAHAEAGRGRSRGIRQCVAADTDALVPKHRTLPPFGLLAEPRARYPAWADGGFSETAASAG